MNLIPSGLIAAANAAMEDVFDTFARDSVLRFYKPETTTTIIADPTFLTDFGLNSAGEPKITVTTVYQDFPVRLRYLDRQESNAFLKGDDTNIRMDQQLNRIEIQVKPDAFEYLKDTVRWEFEGKKFKAEETWSKHGILGSWNVSMIILKEVL